MRARIGSRSLVPAHLVVLWAGVAAPVRAQEEQPPKPVRFTADFSYVDTGGNTDLVTVSMGEKVEYDPPSRFGFRQHLSWVYGRTDGDESGNQLQSGVRGTYEIGSRLELYLGIGYGYDLYAGVKRRFEELGGLSVTVVESTRHRLLFEGGVSFFQETTTEDRDQWFVAGRGAVEYRFQFTEKASVQQSLEYLANLENGGDYRLNSETALVAPLAGIFALKASYVIRYRGQPPAGFETTDTVFRTGIQVTL